MNDRTQKFEDSLNQCEKTHGSSSVEYAAILESFAKHLKSENTRLLDAANMEARAAVIRENVPQPFAPSEPPQAKFSNTGSQQSVLNETENFPVSEERLCPFCAETIKTAAIKCKHCGEFLDKLLPKQHLATVAVKTIAKKTTTNTMSADATVIAILVATLLAIPLFLGAGAAGGAMFGIPIVLVGSAIYMLPTILGVRNQKKNTNAIFVVNFFLGWTLVGWVVALAWSQVSDK